MSLKSNVFAKLDDAVKAASSTTIEGVQILALAASAVKNLNEGTDIEDDVYKLGTVGEIGFGVATAVDSEWQGANCVPLDGHDNILSQNYGNYMHTASSAILVYIPKHYYKIVGNTFSFSDTAKSGYVLDRSFINASKEKLGVFIAKYGGTNNNGKFSAQKSKDPLSTNASHNPISALNGSPAANYGGLYSAVKTMDAKAFLTPIFQYTMLARLSKAHGEAALSTASCAFIDVNPKAPKGNLNNALRDVNDTSVTFVSSGYSNCALTGSGEPFAKTTHNGQKCGIADLTGNMWEVASGFTRTDADGFLILKESVDITTITSDGTVDATGAYYTPNFDVIDLSDLISGDDSWTYLGNGTNQVFGFSTDRTSAAYKRTSIGMPLATGTSGAGTTEFGNDGIGRFLKNQLSPRVGGLWNYPGNAGPWCVGLGDVRTFSHGGTGGRASVFGS
jgi:hypothetical protein